MGKQLDVSVGSNNREPSPGMRRTKDIPTSQPTVKGYQSIKHIDSGKTDIVMDISSWKPWHEVNTPVQAILSAAEFLRLDESITKDMTQGLDVIWRIASTLAVLDDIRGASTPPSNGTAPHRVESNLARDRSFQLALASMPDAVLTTDREMHITYMNASAEVITGWAVSDAFGRSIDEILNVVNDQHPNPENGSIVKALNGKAIAEPVYLKIKDAHGKELYIDRTSAPLRDANGNVLGSVMVFRDITNQRMVSERKEVSEIRYRRLFEAAHDGILIVDEKDCRVLDVNPFMLQFLDQPRDYFIGKELWEIGFFKNREANDAAMQKLNEHGTIRQENVLLKTRNGRFLPVEVVANIYQEDRHSVIQLNVRDMTERARHQAEREAHLINEQSLRMEAEAANRSKDMFLATLSHELRTPLNAIVGWLSVLKDERRTGEELSEGLAVIERNAKAQVQLIGDVLDVSRIISGKLRLEIRSCELAKVITDAIDAVRTSAEAKYVSFQTDFDRSASEIACDPGRVQQVVWNLLSNAVKFCEPNGIVRVTLTRGKSSAKIQVADNGRGIEPEALPFIFDRFRQADSTTRRKQGGLGLGLSIARQLIDLHGGTIVASSAGLGTGATFTIELPVRAAAQSDDLVESSGPLRNLGATMARRLRLDGLRVLIVDDEPDALRAVYKVLEASGAAVTAAGSVQEATRAIASHRPDVLVSDLGMPDEDGYELIHRIRAAGHSGKDLPAVALTAFAHPEDQRRVLLAGYQVHLAKPFDPRDLTVVIASLVGRTGAIAHTAETTQSPKKARSSLV